MATVESKNRVRGIFMRFRNSDQTHFLGPKNDMFGKKLVYGHPTLHPAFLILRCLKLKFLISE